MTNRTIVAYRVSSDRLGKTSLVNVKVPGDEASTRTARRRAYSLSNRWDRDYGSCCTSVGLVFAE